MQSTSTSPGQTLIIRNGIIEQIGKELSFPPDATIVDAEGKFIIPSLSDMHVHIQNKEELQVMALLGIGLVRNMHAHSKNILEWKSLAASGQILSPEIVTAGPLFDGPYKSHVGAILHNPKGNIENEVLEQKKLGYDFIKIYDAVTLKDFYKIQKAAEKAGLPVAGHVPYGVGLAKVLKSKAFKSIEHLSGYAEAMEPTTSPYYRSYKKPWKDTEDYWNDAWRSGTGVRFAKVNEKNFSAWARKTKAAGAWVCPTLVQRDTFLESALRTLLNERDEWKYFPPEMFKGWAKVAQGSPFELPPLEDLEKSHMLRRKLVSALHKNGVKLLIGSDTGNIGVLAGFSAYQEMNNFIEAGLSPYAVLEAATRNAHEFLGRKNGGILEVGQKANMIFLSDNPLTSLTALKKRDGLVLNGKWYSQIDVQKRLDDLAYGYKTGSLKSETFFSK